MDRFDTVVIGLGAVGSACLLQLARRGQRVLGIDRFVPPHAHGSSHGETRVTRCAIGEGEAYVPLVLRSHAIWREVEAETGEELLVACGALILANRAGTAEIHGKGDFVRRTIAAAERFAIPHEVLDAAEIARRFPQFRPRGNELGYFEPGGGFLRPERCIAAQLAWARRLGAAVRTGTEVTAIARDGAGVRVTTADGAQYLADDAVLAAGPWAAGLAGAPLAGQLSVTRQVLHWFATEDDAAFAPDRCPVFIWMHGDRAEDSFYGFPSQGAGQGVKVATEQYCERTAHPDLLRREVSAEEARAMFANHVAGRLAGVLPEQLRAAACMYTMTPDAEFLIDRAPDDARLLVVSACSGHGFKHSAGLGEAVAASLTGAEGGADLTPFLARRFARAG